jgi:uncharacterized protein involved in copper resistance
MIVRRIAALLVMLLMAHLDIARAYAACAREDTHRAADHAQMSHDHASMTDTSAPPAQDSSPVSSQAECCRAMASCVTSLGLNDGTTPNDLFIARSVITASVMGAPASLIFAPEPPPPRA